MSHAHRSVRQHARRHLRRGPVVVGVGVSVAAFACAAGCRDFYVLPAETRADGGAGSDARVEGDAAGTACSPADPSILFCDDFSGPDVNPGWTETDARFASLDSKVFLSAPRSLHVDLPGTHESLASVWIKDIDAPRNANLRVEVSLRVEEAGFIYPFGLFCGPDYAIVVRLEPTIISEQGPGSEYTDNHVDASLTTGAWHRLALSVRRQEGTMTFSVDGVDVLGPQALRGASIVRDNDCSLRFGIMYVAENIRWEAHYDDLVIRTF